MKKKYVKFGKKYIGINLFTQLSFCILMTWLFLETYPHLGNLERPWGAVRDWKGKVVYFFVFWMVVYHIIHSLVEMGTIVADNFALQREILTQKHLAESWSKSNCASAKSNEIRRRSIDQTVGKELNLLKCTFWKTVWKSFQTMLSIYFEMDLAVPSEFHNLNSKQRAHGSVTGFFRMICLISDICFVVAQGAAISGGIVAARALLISMIFVMICEYVLLFLWLQTTRKVSRFLITVVNILRRDIIGFAIMFVVVQVVFSFCFLLLAEEEDVSQKWWRAFFIWYELSVGTGEWFKDELDDMTDVDDMAEDDGNMMDSGRKALLYLTYLIYISITIVILINLLIAVMSETASSLRKQMAGWERIVKLSSVSMLSRRWRANVSIARALGIRCSCFMEKSRTCTIGGKTGEETKIFDGRRNMRENESRQLQRDISLHFGQEESEMTVAEHFSNMRYWTVLEHEPIDTDKGRKFMKHPNFIDNACKAMSTNMKFFLKGYTFDKDGKFMKQSNFIDDICKVMSANMRDFLKVYTVENVVKVD